MRGQRSVCLLCRFAGLPKSAFNGTRRFASSRDREPYVLPRLVIDLDSADSPFVKKAEGPVDDATESGRERERGQKKGSSVKPQPGGANRKALDESNITSYDLLSYAFLGDRAELAPEYHYLLRYLESIGVAPMDSVKTKTEQLLLQTTDNEMNVEYEGSKEKRESEILDQICECNSFEQLRRTLSLLCTTRNGCEVVARNGLSVVASIRRCRRSQLWEPEILGSQQVLQLLNNLRINLESKGIQIGPDICNASIYYASKCTNVAAIQIYLNVSRRNRYKTDLQTVKSMIIVLQRFRVQDNRRTDLMRLLLGLEEGTTIHEGVEREASFSSLLNQDQSHKYLQAMYSTYLNILGVLKLSDEIWKEWKAADRTRVPCLIRDNKGLKAHMFATAFLIAKDPHRAHVVLNSVLHDHKDAAYSRSDKLQIGRDLLKTFSGITRNAVTSRGALFRFMMQYYYCLGLPRTAKLVQKVWDTLGELPTDPNSYAQELQKFLLIDNSTALQGKMVDWGEWDGKQGLIVKERGDLLDESPLKKNGHPFFKPASQVAALEAA